VSYAADIRAVAKAFSAVKGAPVHHYWRPVKSAPWVVWEEANMPTFDADNGVRETALAGYVHLFTATDGDPLADAVTGAMDAAGMTWRLENVQYEDDTKLIHIEWGWAWRG